MGITKEQLLSTVTQMKEYVDNHTTSSGGNLNVVFKTLFEDLNFETSFDVTTSLKRIYFQVPLNDDMKKFDAFKVTFFGANFESIDVWFTTECYEANNSCPGEYWTNAHLHLRSSISHHILINMAIVYPGCSTYEWAAAESANIDTSVSSLYIDKVQGSTSHTVYVQKVQGIKFVNPNNYSTEEQIIGTWIDGKPLYQKTIETTCPSKAATSACIYVFEESMNIDNIVLIDGFVPYEGNGLISTQPLNMYISSSDYVTTWGTNVDIWMKVSSHYINGPAYITIKYTKTTD